MRVTITVDGGGVTLPRDDEPVSTVSDASLDAGSGPGAPDPGLVTADDSGGPPQWLLDAVAAAEAGERELASHFADAGAGPGGAARDGADGQDAGAAPSA